MAIVCLLGLVSLAGSALSLSAYGLGRFLNSDFFTPYFFCLDLLSRRYPLSGWTLSASPYFLPDHALLTGLLGAFDHSGFTYALFTPVYYPALVVLAGLCVRAAVGRTGPAFLASLLFGNGLLALRVLPGHALSLWWIGAPCCHGGVLLLGFAYLWVLGAGLRRGEIGWLAVPLLGLSVAGLLSDTLFLFQVMLPAAVALFLGRRRHPAFTRWLGWQGGGMAAAVLASLLFKLVCQVNGWFYFSRMLRRFPTPANEWRALGQFVSDQPGVLHTDWGFALLAIAAAGSLVYSFRKPTSASSPTEHHAGVLDFYRVFCVASLLVMLPLPVLTCAWRGASNVRYLFNWFVLPGFLLALAAAERWSVPAAAPASPRRRWGVAAAGIFFLVCLGGAVGGLREQPLRFPYPDDVAALDTLLQRRGLQRGLAQYWKAKYVTGLSHAGAELRQIRENGEPYFWDNNAFEYYERDAAGTFRWPAYQFILVNGLDPAALTRAFGEPAVREQAGNFQVWLYDETGQRRIRGALEPAVRLKLGPERSSMLRLPPAASTHPGGAEAAQQSD